MMVKKNLDLELQALHMIQQRNGVVPKVFESGNVRSKLFVAVLNFWGICGNHCTTIAREIFPNRNRKIEDQKFKI
jgi:DNA-binding transcriptional regulator GbsR (MarR family)